MRRTMHFSDGMVTEVGAFAIPALCLKCFRVPVDDLLSEFTWLLAASALGVRQGGWFRYLGRSYAVARRWPPESLSAKGRADISGPWARVDGRRPASAAWHRCTGVRARPRVGTTAPGIRHVPGPSPSGLGPLRRGALHVAKHSQPHHHDRGCHADAEYGSDQQDGDLNSCHSEGLPRDVP